MAPARNCGICGLPLRVEQHRVRSVQFLGSRQVVTQKDRCCGNPEYRSGAQELLRPSVDEARLVLKGCEYGLDVICMIGERHIQEHESFGEIFVELGETHGVKISSRHVSNLFRVYLAIVQARTLNSEAVQGRLKAQGRLILSIDAVKFDDVSPALYVVRELLSGEILLAKRIERADKDNVSSSCTN